MPSHGTAGLATAIADARAAGIPLPAFNVFDLSSMAGVLDGAVRQGRPLITQLSARTVRHWGARPIAEVHRALVAASGARSFLHLDHCADEEVIEAALSAGFDGVMVDGSHLEYEENVALTRGWVERAARSGAIVEGEVTPIAGTEDGFAGGEAGRDSGPERYLDFASRTEVALLGTTVGTAHGLYADAPEIDYDLIGRVGEAGPGFVVHGGSGLEADALRELARRGVAKVNFSTELKIAWSRATADELEGERVPEPLRALTRARRAVSDLVCEKMERLGAP